VLQSLGFQLWICAFHVGYPGIEDLWALLCGAETQNAQGFEASSPGSTLAARLQVVLLSGPPSRLFGFLAPYQSYEQKCWDAPLTLGSWHWNPSVVSVRKVAFSIFSL